MKKFATAMMSFAIMICASLVFAACGGVKITSFELDLSEVTTTIAKGETFDYSKLKVNVTYSNDETAIFDVNTEGLTVDTSLINKDVVGTYKVTVTYETFSREFNVAVKDDILVDRSAIPSTVTIGSTFDWKDLLTVTVLDKTTGQYREVTDYTVDDSAFNNTTAGTYNIVVISDDLRFTFTVTVVESTGSQMAFDGDTTVIFNHATYNLPDGEYTLMLADNETSAPASAYVFTPATSQSGANIVRFQIVENGDYVLRYTKDGEPKERKFRSIDYLTLFGSGTDWADYKATVASLGTDNSTFKNAEEQPYVVGTGNAFHFDLSMDSAKDDSTKVVADQNLLNYTFFVKNDATWDEITDLSTLVMIDGENFTFKNGAENANLGKTYKVVVAPKYQHATSAEFVFTLNDGVNVFTSEDLTNYFANFNVQTINLHRNIVATLTDDQFNPNGSLFNAYTSNSNVIDSVDIQNNLEWLTKTRDECVAAGKYIIYNADGTLAKNYSNSPYVRFSNHITNDNLVIFGNYFNVDGRSLPLLEPAKLVEYSGQGDYLQEPTADDPTYATDSQAALFITGLQSAAFATNLANAKADVKANGYANATLATKDGFNALENNSTTFNNLSIVANGQVPSGDLTEDERKEYISKISGSYSAIRACSDVNVNNVNIRYACIGLYGTERGVDMNVNYAHISDTWANGVYYRVGSELNLKNTYIGASGGTAVWLEDREQMNGDVFDPYIVFDDTVTIDNFVVGSEPWFVAQKVSTIVPSAKVLVDDNVKALSGNTKSIVTQHTSTAGLTSELFNFALVIINKYDIDDKIETGANDYHNISQRYTYCGQEVLRMTVTTDPRNTSGGFAAVIDEYAPTDAFLAEATEQGTIAGGALLYDMGAQSTANTQAKAVITNEMAGYEVAVAVYKAALVRMGADASTLTTYISQVAYKQMNGLTSTSTQSEIITYLGNGAGFALMYSSFNNPNNKYVEVIQDVPTQGKLLMITEFFDIAS